MENITEICKTNINKTCRIMWNNLLATIIFVMAIIIGLGDNNLNYTTTFNIGLVIWLLLKKGILYSILYIVLYTIFTLVYYII